MIAVEYHQLVSPCACESVSIPTMPAYKLDGVSTLYNVEFEKKGMRVWKAYGLGAGRLRTETCSSGDLPSVVMFQAHTDRFSGVKDEHAPSKVQKNTKTKIRNPKTPTMNRQKHLAMTICLRALRKDALKHLSRHSSIHL